MAKYRSLALCTALIAVCSATAAESHYTVLGVPRDASLSAIRKAYHTLALIHHPDKQAADADPDRFRKIARAYETLANPLSRRRYDLGLDGIPAADSNFERFNRKFARNHYTGDGELGKAPFLLIREDDENGLWWGGSVVLILRYSAKGSYGVVINKVAEGGVRYRRGGPMARESLQGVLHRHGDHCGGERLDRGNTSETGVWWGGRCKDNDLEHISNTSQNGSSCSSMQSKFSMFFLRGYAGWGGRQLDEEVWRGSWHVTKTLGESGGPSAQDLFTLDGRAQWVDLWKRFLDHPAPPPPSDEHGIYEHNRDDFRTEVERSRDPQPITNDYDEGSEDEDEGEGENED